MLSSLLAEYVYTCNAYLLPSVARKYTSSGASIQLITGLRPPPPRVICAIFGFPFKWEMCRGSVPCPCATAAIMAAYWSGVGRCRGIGSFVGRFAGGPVITEPVQTCTQCIFYIHRSRRLLAFSQYTYVCTLIIKSKWTCTKLTIVPIQVGVEASKDKYFVKILFSIINKFHINFKIAKFQSKNVKTKRIKCLFAWKWITIQK